MPDTELRLWRPSAREQRMTQEQAAAVKEQLASVISLAEMTSKAALSLKLRVHGTEASNNRSLTMQLSHLEFDLVCLKNSLNDLLP